MPRLRYLDAYETASECRKFRHTADKSDTFADTSLLDATSVKIYKYLFVLMLGDILPIVPILAPKVLLLMSYFNHNASMRR